ncbi:hydroxyisourate hydrolase [Sneathiella sp.]|uniref:hydroxyisourate hydrolase n=1 Tax=Sneathiella sp. TaxID=1964365 RepID=UPI0035637ABB
MGKLTTHVLDTATGRPGGGIAIDLYRISMNDRASLKTVTTNADGRCDGPLLEGAAFEVGQYEMIFHVGGYFNKQDGPLAAPPFLDEIVVRFGISDATEHYHVPLLVSPYSYSTYRGS